MVTAANKCKSVENNMVCRRVTKTNTAAKITETKLEPKLMINLHSEQKKIVLM